MPVFITQGRYTADAMRGMMANPEENRADSLAALFQASGGKLLAYYMTFGEYDFLVISEGPSEGVPPSTIVTAASGTVTDLKTTLAIPASEMKGAFAKAGSLVAGFRAAGAR